MNKLFLGFATTVAALVLSSCAGNAPAKDDSIAQTKARADAEYEKIDDEPEASSETSSAAATPANASVAAPAEVPSVEVTKASFKTTPTVLVIPALTGNMNSSIDVVRRNPLAKTAMETINAHMTKCGYNVVGLESQAQLNEVVELQSSIAGNDDDLSYVAGLAVGADINIIYAGSIQEGDIVIDLNASEASTANLLASESVRMKVSDDDSQRALVQKAVNEAVVKLEAKVREKLAAQLELGVQYKVIAHLTSDVTDDQAEEISNMVSMEIRKKFNKMQVLSMSRNTYDLMVYVDPEKYEDAQMVYGAFYETLNGLAKVRKQNITKKLIILEIQ